MSKFQRTLATKVVTTAGIAEPLVVSSQGFVELVIQAKTSNTGSVFIGSSLVTSTVGLELVQGASKDYNLPGDLKDISIDVETSGDGVILEYVASGSFRK